MRRLRSEILKLFKIGTRMRRIVIPRDFLTTLAAMNVFWSQP